MINLVYAARKKKPLTLEILIDTHGNCILFHAFQALC